MMYIMGAEHDFCDDDKIPEVLIGLMECGNGCVILNQDDDVIELTARQAKELAAALDRREQETS